MPQQGFAVMMPVRIGGIYHRWVGCVREGHRHKLAVGEVEIG